VSTRHRCIHLFAKAKGLIELRVDAVFGVKDGLQPVSNWLLVEVTVVGFPWAATQLEVVRIVTILIRVDPNGHPFLEVFGHVAEGEAVQSSSSAWFVHFTNSELVGGNVSQIPRLKVSVGVRGIGKEGWDKESWIRLTPIVPYVLVIFSSVQGQTFTHLGLAHVHFSATLIVPTSLRLVPQLGEAKVPALGVVLLKRIVVRHVFILSPKGSSGLGSAFAGVSVVSLARSNAKRVLIQTPRLLLALLVHGETGEVAMLVELFQLGWANVLGFFNAKLVPDIPLGSLARVGVNVALDHVQLGPQLSPMVGTWFSPPASLFAQFALPHACETQVFHNLMCPLCKSLCIGVGMLGDEAFITWDVVGGWSSIGTR